MWIPSSFLKIYSKNQGVIHCEWRPNFFGFVENSLFGLEVADIMAEMTDIMQK